MKTPRFLNKVLVIAVLAAAIQSCAPMGAASRPPKDYSQYANLAEVLRSEGVTVNGYGSQISINLRGQSSIQLDTRPLFVVNGAPMGRDYNTVNASVLPSTIKSIRVIRDVSGTTRYGDDANSGVIEIKTKTAGDLESQISNH